MKEIEEKYLRKQNSFMLTESILSSFSRTGLKRFIEEAENDYIKVMVPYQRQIAEIKNKQELDEIRECFVEKFYYYFHWGEELKMNRDFIKKCTNYYKLHHTNFVNKKGYKKIDVNAIPITQIIWMYIKIPDNFRKNILCPLHDDSSPSFRIYEKTNSFYCFGCWKWGNVVNFVAEKEWISTKEAFKKIINLYK